jgi:hypothetical protein
MTLGPYDRDGKGPRIRAPLPKAREIADRLAADPLAVCHWLLPNGHVEGANYVTGSVYDVPGRSLRVALRGNKAGKWGDFANPEHRGDLLNLIYYVRGCVTVAEAMGEAADWLRLDRPPLAQLDRARPLTRTAAFDTTPSAWRVWLAGRPIAGTAAARYFERRGLVPPDPARYRFALHLEYRATKTTHPGLLFRVDDPAGEFVGINRIFLTDAGDKAAVLDPKQALGSVNKGTIWHTPPASTVILAEGGEDGLAICTALPAAAVWSATTAAHLGNFQPPTGLQTLIIAQQNDQEGAAATARLLRNFAAAGDAAIRILVHTATRKDHDEDLQADGPAVVAAGFRAAYQQRPL